MTVEFGDPRLPRRFWSKVRQQPAPADARVSGPCWVWIASLTSQGYGQFHWQAHMHRSHRVVRAVLVGDVSLTSEGTHDHLDHLCRVRRCVNPAHLDPVSNQENSMRGARAYEFTGLCRAGLHPIRSEADVKLTSKGERHCRACHLLRIAERSELERRAAKHLGMKIHDYRAVYGGGKTAARRVLGES